MDIRIPILWTDLAPRIRWDMVVRLEAEDSFPADPAKWSVLDASSKPYDLLADFESGWNERRISQASGKTHELDNKAEGLQLLVDSSGKHEPRPIVELTTKYQVDSQTYLGWFTPEECQRVFSYMDGRFQPSYLDIGSVPLVRDPTWPRVDDPSRLAIEPVAPLVVTATPTVERSSFRGALGEVRYLGSTYP